MRRGWRLNISKMYPNLRPRTRRCLAGWDLGLKRRAGGCVKRRLISVIVRGDQHRVRAGWTVGAGGPAAEGSERDPEDAAVFSTGGTRPQRPMITSFINQEGQPDHLRSSDC